LINLPLIYFEIEDVRPDENEGQDIDENEGQENSSSVLNSGGVSVPGELVQGILQFLTGKDLLRFARASKATFQVVARCKALHFDTIRKRIDNLVDDLFDRGRRQVNLHRFKEKNRVRVNKNGVRVDAYCVRVTSKYVYYVRAEDIFTTHPEVRRVKSKRGVSHVRPYVGSVVEVVQNWRFGRIRDL
jgi:hypothetical protein